MWSCIFSFRAGAQNPSSYYIEEPPLFRGGLVAGANFGQVDGDKYAGYYKVGINAGVTLYTRLNNLFSLSMELLYAQKGAKSNFIKGSSSNIYNIIDQRISLHYAEVPVMLNITDVHKNYVGAGLAYARLISGTETIVTSPNANYNGDDYPFKKYDVSFVATGNLCLVKGLYAGLRFQYSLLPIRTKVDYEFARAKQYNNVWVLRVMYLF
ncbi:hypothetical protein GCM10023092_13890 [Rurimicrobium arvi]|uniref:Outer membrane protein beta-barrel domain-containing protein n=1 Tax=Rurimicrobium arvi TaxID=2049916 RepID=A0ABP8MRZ8_9BACT